MVMQDVEHEPNKGKLSTSSSSSVLSHIFERGEF